MTVAIIGGTGLEQTPAEWAAEPLVVDTRFGQAPIVRARVDGQEVIFLSRHGATHGIAPHRINYHANIAALEKLGVTDVFATNAVGSLRRDLLPGSLLLLSDFIDFTRSRGVSYLDGDAQAGVVHTDFSEPYSTALRDTVLEAAADLDAKLLPRGVYLCAEGPRYESPAEVRLFADWGADVVGMTGLPEAVFAREAGMRYAAVAIVTNYAAGIGHEPISHEEVVREMSRNAQTVSRLLLNAARLIAR